MLHRAALFVEDGRLDKAAPNRLLLFSLASCQLISLFFLPWGESHTAVLATLALLGSAVVDLLYFSNECLYEIEGDAS